MIWIWIEGISRIYTITVTQPPYLRIRKGAEKVRWRNCTNIKRKRAEIHYQFCLCKESCQTVKKLFSGQDWTAKTENWCIKCFGKASGETFGSFVVSIKARRDVWITPTYRQRSCRIDHVWTQGPVWEKSGQSSANSFQIDNSVCRSNCFTILQDSGGHFQPEFRYQQICHWPVSFRWL